ncbi:MAG: alginate export family protein [Gemmatimonadota bacterium]
MTRTRDTDTTGGDMATRAVGLFLAAAVLATPAAAQELELNGQVRPRLEIRDPVGEDGTVEFTTMRTRLSLDVAVAPSIAAFVQIQDVRMFGEETSTLADYSADGLDLHQGWVELGDPNAEGWSVRVGRQEAAYGGERLVGAVNWTQQARSFDGARVRFRPSSTAVVDGVAFRLADSDAAGITADRNFYGLYSTLEANGDLDLFGLVTTQDAIVQDYEVYTLGARWVSGTDAVDWRLEAAYQGGETRTAGVETDRSAFLLGGRIGTALTDRLTGTLWYDYLSGDDDPTDDTSRTFDTLFATNHKFYGFMDLFLNIPASTAERGLQDLAFKTSYDVAEDQSLAADLHIFSVAAKDGIDTAHIGEELDLTYRWSYAPGVTLTGGLSYFLAGDAWAGVLGNPDENQVWGYVMVDVVF